MSNERLPFDETYLREKLTHNPTDWDTRLLFADGLYDKEAYAEAAEVIWNAKYIPSNDLDLALSIRILAKAQPRKAIRLLTAVLELNQAKPAHNLAMAAAMLHYGMVLQATRFYGAAVEADSNAVNPDLEYFILNFDEKSTMPGLLGKKLPKVGQIHRLVRDPREALMLSSRLSLSDHPICLPDLAIAAGEEFKREFAEQKPTLADLTPQAPISRSSVPTAVLHVKWSTAPPKTEESAIPVTPPPVAPFAPADSPAPGPRKLNIPGIQ
ncbi:MAG: hypothetical protein V4727_06745 [Verrucomicrobiota bacterium]